MPMSVETYRRNLQWIEDQKAIGYRFECRTKLKWPKPEDVERILKNLPIVCAPLHKERVWLFETEDAMRRFKQNYTTLDNAT